jgi:hypothetical protein
METLKDILWPIVLVGGLGAFIDFLIGKAGQARAKDFLLRWWVRFDDVRWRNFGREEGLFAARLIERWFGKRIFSLRRIVAAVLLYLIFLIIAYLIVITLSANPSVDWFASAGDWVFSLPGAQITLRINPSELIENIAATYLIYFLAFSISASITKYLSFKIAYLCGSGEIRNFLVFALMLVVNCLIILIWFPVAEMNRVWFLTFLNEISSGHHITSVLNRTFQTVIYSRWVYLYLFFEPPFHSKLFFLFSESSWSNKIYIHSLRCLILFPSIMRFILATIFVGSFLLKPLIMRPMSLVWARIIESEKPVFTLIFGGAAAFATALSEAAKHL